MKKISGKKVYNTAKVLLNKDIIGVKYSKTPTTKKNWGDALNAYLLPKISGKKIIHYSEYYNTGLTTTVAGIGSILDNNHVKNLYVWGSGFKSSNSLLPISPRKIFAVRGHFTKRKLHNLSVACPDIFGDPAIVLPKFYQPENRSKQFKIGIIPHYVDKNSRKLISFEKNPEIKIIDIENSIENFINEISTCEIIASSSLHGLIAADAYHIPRVWLKLSNNIAGGDFKFHDYFSTTDCKKNNPLILTDDIQKIVDHTIQPQKLADIEKLIDSFPLI